MGALRNNLPRLRKHGRHGSQMTRNLDRRDEIWMLLILVLLILKRVTRTERSKHMDKREMLRNKHTMISSMMSNKKRIILPKERESEKSKLTKRRNKREMRSSMISKDSSLKKKAS